MHEEKLCLPLGAAIGAITGASHGPYSAPALGAAPCHHPVALCAGIMNERWRSSPPSGGGRPAESDSDAGSVGGGRSIFGFGDERLGGSSSRGGGDAFGDERTPSSFAPSLDSEHGAAGGMNPPITIISSHSAEGGSGGGSRRMVAGGGGAGDLDSFDPFKQKTRL